MSFNLEVNMAKIILDKCPKGKRRFQQAYHDIIMNMIFARNAAKFLQSSLRWKVTLGLVFPLIVFMGILTYVDYSRLYQAMLKELSVVVTSSGQLIEQNLRQQMVKMDFDAMQQMLDSISASQGFRAIYLLNRNGKVIFSPNSSGVGLRLSNTQTDCQPCHHLDASARPPSIIVDLPGEVRVFRTMQAIKNGPSCVKCHDAAQPIIGLLLIDVPTAPFERSINEQLREHLLWWLGTVITTILMINFILGRFVLRRLENYSNILRHSDQTQAMPVLEVYSKDELGKLAETFNELSRQVEIRRKENMMLSEDLRRQITQRGELLRHIIHVQEDERKRVAREIHDEFGTSLSGLALQAEAARKFLESDPERAKDQISGMKSLIVETTERMYSLIMALRPSLLDDLGLAAALRSTAEQILGKAGIAFQMDISQFSERLPKEIETPLYRIFQEAIFNIVRHSGATLVSIQLVKNELGFSGTIADNGEGFEFQSIQTNGRDPRGLGLLGMQERVTQCGGTIQFDTSPGKGTKIMIRIPLAASH